MQDRKILNERGELNLSMEDIKQGRGLEKIENFIDHRSRAEQINTRKKEYYKNLGPKKPIV